MKLMKTRNVLPGSLAVNIAIMVFGLLLAGCALTLNEPNYTIAYLLSGLGGGMFVAGFIGLLNTEILSREIHKAANQPFEDICLLSQVRGSGLEAIARDRESILNRVIDSIDRECKQVIINGSTLKGFIGVGYQAVGENERVRNAILKCLQNGGELNVLMTHPAIAHHRSQQEGRSHGDIESEIIENLMYLLMIKHKQYLNHKLLNIKLYDGTPTIFMVCTSELMLINPYTYHSTGYNSYAFIARSQSDLYRGYFSSHFQNAWSDFNLAKPIQSDLGLAIEQIMSFITDNNEHGRPIVPNPTKRKDLLAKLEQLTYLICDSTKKNELVVKIKRAIEPL